MRQALSAPREVDPIGWSIVMTLLFGALVAWHLGIPSRIYFDELHYVPAARRLLDLYPANVEHPMLGKEAIAASIALLGDHPWAWRVPSAVMGTAGLFAFSRAMWWASGRRHATIVATLLLLTDLSWFTQSRIAMLDMVMAGLGMIGLWQVAAATRLPGRRDAGGWRPGTARARLAAAGICLGLAMGAKWSILPAVALVALGFVVARVGAAGRTSLYARDVAPVRGIALPEALWWLGVVPLLAYGLTYLPACWYHQNPLNPREIIAWHQTMLHLQASVVRPHPAQSVWWQWMLDGKPIWFLYGQNDGGWRGIVLMANPFSAIAGLPAVGWCLWAGLRHGRADALALALLYLGSLGLWVVDGKPVQFFYHYLLPAAFLMGCLALCLDWLWRREDWRNTVNAALGLTVAVAIGFYPVISGLALADPLVRLVTWNPALLWRHGG